MKLGMGQGTFLTHPQFLGGFHNRTCQVRLRPRAVLCRFGYW